MRNQVDLDHPRLAIGQGLFAGVFHMLAAQAFCHMGLNGPPGLVANSFLDRQPEDGFCRVPVVGCVALVGELAAQMRHVVIGHQRGHRIGDQPQQ
ncbi:hypothetical protein D3C71_1884590 [compost metagenome]